MSDEELKAVILAFSQCRGVRYFHDLSVEMEDQMLLALEELRRWREAFAWLFKFNGSVCYYVDEPGMKWFATGPACNSDLKTGETALEAIEALKKKVEKKLERQQQEGVSK